MAHEVTMFFVFLNGFKASKEECMLSWENCDFKTLFMNTKVSLKHNPTHSFMYCPSQI